MSICVFVSVGPSCVWWFSLVAAGEVNAKYESCVLTNGSFMQDQG